MKQGTGNTLQTRRNPILALLMSIVFIGWGLLYVGRPKAALRLAGATYGFVIIAGVLGLVSTPADFQLLVQSMLLAYLGSALLAVWYAFKSKGVERFPGWKAHVAYVLGMLLVNLVLVPPVRGVVLGYNLYQIPSMSMAPTLSPGDRLIVSTRYDTPSVGDVAVYWRNERKMVSRIAAVAGDTLSIVDGDVINNGRNLGLFHAQPNRVIREHSLDLAPVTVAPGHVFVLGDNRDNSNDSRFTGQVSVTDITEKVTGIFYSKDPARIGTVFGPDD